MLVSALSRDRVRQAESRSNDDIGGAMLLRRIGVLTSGAFVCLVLSGAEVFAQTPRTIAVVERQAMNATRGRVSGSVSDEHGGPLPGAMVSLLGVTMATTTANEAGHFSLEALPVGEYI